MWPTSIGEEHKGQITQQQIWLVSVRPLYLTTAHRAQVTTCLWPGTNSSPPGAPGSMELSPPGAPGSMELSQSGIRWLGSIMWPVPARVVIGTLPPVASPVVNGELGRERDDHLTGRWVAAGVTQMTCWCIITGYRYTALRRKTVCCSMGHSQLYSTRNEAFKVFYQKRHAILHVTLFFYKHFRM